MEFPQELMRRNEGLSILLLLGGAAAMAVIAWQSHELKKAVRVEEISLENLLDQTRELKSPDAP